MNDQDESRNVEDVRGSSGGGHMMYGIFLNAFEWALPMNA